MRWRMTGRFQLWWILFLTCLCRPRGPANPPPRQPSVFTLITLTHMLPCWLLTHATPAPTSTSPPNFSFHYHITTYCIFIFIISSPSPTASTTSRQSRSTSANILDCIRSVMSYVSVLIHMAHWVSNFVFGWTTTRNCIVSCVWAKNIQFLICIREIHQMRLLLELVVVSYYDRHE